MKTDGTNVEDKTKHISKVCYDQKRMDGPICKIAEVILRVPEECAIILWEAVVWPEVKRVHYQPILSMCIQYYDKWKAYYNNMERQLVRNIARWRRWSDKSKWLDEGNNLRNSHEWIPWEETWLPHNGPWTLSGWRSRSDNDGLPKEDCVWLSW